MLKKNRVLYVIVVPVIIIESAIEGVEIEDNI